MTENTNLTVHVLMRSSKKTGKVDMTMIGLGKAMLQLWALQNTPKTKSTMVFERESGRLVFKAVGDPSGFPKIFKDTKDAFLLETCKDYGIPLETLHGITDPRFDKKEE